ncbi:uncharacterized protein J3R85_002130 [Psidium guajava]|nr:uncharacterized protein J3R85_002130 [Psidium guajava]
MIDFAVRLTADEVAAMQNKPGFLATHPAQIYCLQTTRSPQFLGLPLHQGSFKRSTMGKGVIIGVMDTGITPDHPSFQDSRMPPSPVKWKERCDFEPSQCNNKLIDARTFNSSSKKIVTMPPVDDVGHGTHTASTTVGAFVEQANTLGMAQGTAVGMAPYAHLAIYQMCFTDFCDSADILAGLDAAVADGVDVISMSIGGPSYPFYMDDIAVAVFAATQIGIFISCSAGNSGPASGTISNAALWMLTVGASKIDRNIVSNVKLGNGAEYEVQILCYGSIEKQTSEGKVVLCELGGDRFEQAIEVKRAGGAPMILMNPKSDRFTTLADVYILPASHVSYFAGEEIKAYINSTKIPTATIVFKGSMYENPTASVLAASSSRGPSLVSLGILKPDIIGHGLNILAAWPFPVRNDTEAKYYFDILAGTSMFGPHLSGIAALIKSIHPDWSPAVIKSAIMTSAKQLNVVQNPILDKRLQLADVFAIGSDHVDPGKVVDPGLVYDIQPDDYISYLCGLRYTDKQVAVIARKRVNCSSCIPEGELNYPSFSVTLGPAQKFTRTVTNVGAVHLSYVVTIVTLQGIQVRVNPATLKFMELHQKATYSITFSRANSIE